MTHGTTLHALVKQWRERVDKERIIAKRDPGSTASMKAIATALAYESAATELEEQIVTPAAVGT